MIAYIISVAFQIVGAIALLLNCFGFSREKQFFKKEYFGDGLLAFHENKPLDKIRSIEVLKGIWKSRLSLVYIILGYIIGVFGSIGNAEKLFIVLFIILATIIFLLILQALAWLLAFISYKIAYEGKVDV
ncbi:hypothetical protein [Butyrivibrio fibrisolvens]|uniref:hypothetical protein n=1 Tax=Butyrivibrio fibrisolvens TaxID=831 RepID=UPI0003B46586|nr:hypothetical protein [Butyrivibrio fibrisolvens]